MNAIELIAALKGADEETAMELVDRLQCGEIDCSVLPTGKDNAVLQAQIWAQEARTQKGIVEEIGKLVGCANDWEMVDAIKAALSANGGEAGCPRCKGKGEHVRGPANCPSVTKCKLCHPAPPSVAVPEEIRAALSPDNWGSEGPAYEPYDKRTLRLSMDQFDALQEWLTAAPAPDHSGDSSKVVDDLPGMWDQSDLSGGETDVHPPKHHTLKTDPAVFDRSAAGRKPWEIRLNDRDFQVGDTVTLQETVFSGAQMREGAALGFTGKELTGQITYVLRGPKYGLAEGWCIFSVEPDHIADAGKVVSDGAILARAWYHAGEDGDYNIYDALNADCPDCVEVLIVRAEAAPSPDHSGDAGKVVTDSEFSDEFAKWWEEHGQFVRAGGGNYERTFAFEAWRHLYPRIAAPSVPENEIKARALEEYADQLDVVFANAQEAGATDCPAWHAGQFAKDARKQAARLRTAGDEGEGV